MHRFAHALLMGVVSAIGAGGGAMILLALGARLPRSGHRRDAYVAQVRTDGLRLPDALATPTAPPAAAGLPAVAVLRRVWERHFERLDGDRDPGAPPKVRQRAVQGCSPGDRIGSPYDVDASASPLGSPAAPWGPLARRASPRSPLRTDFANSVRSFAGHLWKHAAGILAGLFSLPGPLAGHQMVGATAAAMILSVWLGYSGCGPQASISDRPTALA